MPRMGADFWGVFHWPLSIEHFLFGIGEAGGRKIRVTTMNLEPIQRENSTKIPTKLPTKERRFLIS